MLRSVLIAAVALSIVPSSALGADSRFRQDAKSLFQTDNFLILAAGMGVAGAVYRLDDNLLGKLEENPLLEATDVTNLYGSTTFNLSLSFGLWSLGRAAGHTGLTDLSSEMLRTLTYVQLVVGPIKHAVGRERPDGSNRLSFPSGHTANSFALAELFRQRYGWKTGAPMYVLGTLTALGRMEENVHHLSDVAAGAVIGYVIGRSVGKARTSHFRLSPYGTGLSASLSF